MRTLIGFGVFLSLVSGCGRPSLDIPNEVAEVEANRERFQQPNDDPLLHIEPGTVIDDLSGLEGCWGFYVQQQTTSGVFDGDEFIRFELETGPALRQILIRNPLGDTLDRDTYAVSVDPGSDTVSFQLTGDSHDFASPLLDFFALVTPNRGSGQPVLDLTAEAQPFEVSITLDGDAFVITGSTGRAARDASFPFVVGSIYRRFDCPESTAP